MTCQGMDSPQTPHREAELLRYLHLCREGPMEAIPVGVLPGQLSRSLVNPVPVSRLLLWSPSEEAQFQRPRRQGIIMKPQPKYTARRRVGVHITSSARSFLNSGWKANALNDPASEIEAWDCPARSESWAALQRSTTKPSRRGNRAFGSAPKYRHPLDCSFPRDDKRRSDG